MAIFGRSGRGAPLREGESALARLRSVAFPIDRRGYSKRAVERFLDQVAQELEDLPRSGAASGSAEVHALLGAAKLEADRLQAEAAAELVAAQLERAEAQQLLSDARARVAAAPIVHEAAESPVEGFATRAAAPAQIPTPEPVSTPEPISTPELRPADGSGDSQPTAQPPSPQTPATSEALEAELWVRARIRESAERRRVA